MKSKRLWIVIGLIVFFLLVAELRQQSAAFISLFMAMDSAELDTLEKRLSVIGNSLAILTAVIGGFIWLISQLRAADSLNQKKTTPPVFPRPHPIMMSYWRPIIKNFTKPAS